MTTITQTITITITITTTTTTPATGNSHNIIHFGFSSVYESSVASITTIHIPKSSTIVHPSSFAIQSSILYFPSSVLSALKSSLSLDMSLTFSTDDDAAPPDPLEGRGPADGRKKPGGKRKYRVAFRPEESAGRNVKT